MRYHRDDDCAPMSGEHQILSRHAQSAEMLRRSTGLAGRHEAPPRRVDATMMKIARAGTRTGKHSCSRNAPISRGRTAPSSYARSMAIWCHVIPDRSPSQAPPAR